MMSMSSASNFINQTLYEVISPYEIEKAKDRRKYVSLWQNAQTTETIALKNFDDDYLLAESISTEDVLKTEGWIALWYND